MLMHGKDPAKPESYDHPIFVTEAGDLAHLTDHGHGPMHFQFVREGSPFKVDDEVPHDLKTEPGNAEAIRWLESAGDALWH